MEHEPPQPPELPPRAPPVQPTDPMSGARSSWPAVIGILQCVLGGIGLMYRLFGLVGLAIMPLLPLPPEAKVAGTIRGYTLILALVGLPISVVHIVAGIQTLRRRPSARLWIIAYFVYALVLLAPNAVPQYTSVQQQLQRLSQQGSLPAGFAAWGPAIGILAVVLSVVITLAWPVFLMVWYSRATIREEIQSWSAASGAG